MKTAPRWGLVLAFLLGPHAAALAQAVGALDAIPLPEDATLSDLEDLLEQGIEHPFLYRVYQRKVVRVKFEDRCRVRLRDGKLTDVPAPPGGLHVPERALDNLALQAALTTLAQWGVEWHPSFSLTEERIEELMAAARERSPGRDLPDLNNYFLLHLPGEVTSGAVVQFLRDVPGIQFAWFLPQPTPLPSGAACLPNFTIPERGVQNGYQFYLDQAPDGVDALYAWAGPFGDAQGITITDVEYDFRRTHADQPPVSLDGPTFVPFTLSESRTRSHGSAVLGVLGGLENQFGITGIAKGADFRFASQMRESFFIVFSDPADGILRALNSLDPGDIIVCEMQIGGPNLELDLDDLEDQNGLVAVSYDRAAYDVIDTAVGSLVTVCEAAGNGSENLDAVDYSGTPGWDAGEGPFLPAFDTGSIIVGAGQPFDSADGTLTGRAPESFSNFGSTVDLQGWGSLATSAGYGDLFNDFGPNLAYTRFGGTSAATPIVAGCCAVMQRLFQAKNGQVATPVEIRDLLRSTGSPQAGTGNIGPRPDLRAAINSLTDQTIFTKRGPIMIPDGGFFMEPQVIELRYGSAGQDLTNTRIHYTFDGSDPTLDDLQAIPETGSNRVYLGYTATVRARSFMFDADLQRWFPSGLTSELFFLEDNGQVGTPQIAELDPLTEAPVRTLTDGTFDAPLKIAITTIPSDATIKYRTDGDRFSLFWFKAGTSVGSGDTITLGEGNYELVARGFKNGLDNSELTPNVNITVVDFAIDAGGGQFQLQPPAIFPPGGTFANQVTVGISSPVPGGAIHFTLDGTEPDETSPVYLGEPLTLVGSTTVKARVFRNGYLPSTTASEDVEVLGESDLAPPTIFPNGGVFVSSVGVSITAGNPMAEIRYTTNGSFPNANSTLYTGPVSLGIGFHTVKARAFFENLPPTNASTANFSVFDPSNVVQTPVLTPGGGNSTGATTVELTTTTQGAAIHYTIDDLGTVTQSDPLYSPLNPIVLNPSPNPQIIRAKAFKAGLVDSFQTQASFNVFTPVGAMGEISFDPPAGTYDNAVSVELSCPVSSATFYTTSDGSDPNKSSTATQRNRATAPFTTPSRSVGFTVSRSGVLRASAQRLGFLDSPVADAEYLFVCGTPVFTPASGDYPAPLTVSLTNSTSSDSIYYTTDGSIPDSGSTRYIGPFTLNAGEHTVNAIAIRNNFADSEVATAVFNLADPLVPAAPVITSALFDQTIAEGEEVVLAIDATGVPDPEYRWTFEGVPLAFFGPELVLPEVSAAEAGPYEVTVENSEGMASSSATLTVTPPPPPLEILTIDLEPDGDVLITFPTDLGFDYEAEVYVPGPAADWELSGAILSGTGVVEALSVPVPGSPPEALVRVRRFPGM